MRICGCGRTARWHSSVWLNKVWLKLSSITPCTSCLHSNDSARFQEDLLNIARTTLSSKLLTHHKDHFAKLAVNAVMRLKGSGNLDAIHVIKKLGGSLTDSYLDEGEAGDVITCPTQCHTLIGSSEPRVCFIQVSCWTRRSEWTNQRGWRTPRSWSPTPAWTLTRSRWVKTHGGSLCQTEACTEQVSLTSRTC